MLKLALALLLAAPAAAHAPRERQQNGKILTRNEYNVDAEWLWFKNKYNKIYADAKEEAYRKKVFEISVARADDRNDANVAAGGKPIFGITKFSDRTQTEFDTNNKGRKGHGYMPKDHADRVKQPPKDFSTPTSIAWQDLGYTTPVKNQGQCGSCWANSATEQIESQWMLAGQAPWELSVQQVTSCTAGTFGCGGGDTTGAYEQIINDATKFGEATSGVAAAAMVPYQQSMYEECVGPVCTIACDDLGVGNLTVMASEVALTGPYVSLSGYSFATPACTGACGSQDLDTLNANVAATAPASICVNAGMWNDYVGGVMTTEACGGYAYSDLDHCVQLTGFNLTAAEPYYYVRNSWATNWGEDGYILLSSEGNTCGLADEATFVDVVVS